MKKRVVITGMGIVSPLGCNPDEVYQNAINGVNAIKRIDNFDVEELKVKNAAQVQGFDPLKYIDKKEIRRLDLFSQYAIYAAKEAYADAKLDETNHKKDDFGVIIGSGIGGMQTFARDLYTSFEKGINRIPPMFIPMVIPNMAAGNVAIALQAQNHCSCTATACSSANNAIGDAYFWILNGQAKLMVAGGSEAGVCPHTLSGFNALTALSTKEDVNEACTPFDKRREGFVLGEGAGVLILEELEHAKARGAKIYAEIVGYASTCDAYHITAPSGDGAVKAIRNALNNAGISHEDIDYINAHGTGTPLNDKFETKAIKEVFQDYANKVSISSTKSMHGHALGAAGGIEAVISIKTIQNDIIPPTINYKEFDEDCDLDYTPNVKKERVVNYAMSNSLGFGGHNAILVFRKYGE